MLKKKPVKKSDKVSVTFEIEGFETAKKMCVVGEFNDWQLAKTPMKRRKDGAWAANVRLPNAARYEYCFVVDDRDWMADDQADEVVPNPFGGKNSVVVL
jgi:1,4-alpha-glucan branching enzyme